MSTWNIQIKILATTAYNCGKLGKNFCTDGHRNTRHRPSFFVKTKNLRRILYISIQKHKTLHLLHYITTRSLCTINLQILLRDRGSVKDREDESPL